MSSSPCTSNSNIPNGIRSVCAYASIIRFLLSPFPIVSVAVCITVFTRFDRCLNLFQSITRHRSAGTKLLCIWNFLSAAFFGIRVLYVPVCYIFPCVICSRVLYVPVCYMLYVPVCYMLYVPVCYMSPCVICYMSLCVICYVPVCYMFPCVIYHMFPCVICYMFPCVIWV